MLNRLWANHRNTCLLTLVLLVIGFIVSPWVLLAAMLPVGWVLLKNNEKLYTNISKWIGNKEYNPLNNQSNLTN